MDRSARQTIHRTHSHHYRKSALFRCIIPLLMPQITSKISAKTQTATLLSSSILTFLTHTSTISSLHVEDDAVHKIILQAENRQVQPTASPFSSNVLPNSSNNQYKESFSSSSYKHNNKFQGSKWKRKYRWGYKNSSKQNLTNKNSMPTDHKNTQSPKTHTNPKNGSKNPNSYHKFHNSHNLTLRAMRARKKYPRSKLLHLSDSTGVCQVQDSEKRDCGWPGIKRWQCRKKGCCFDPSSQNTIWCFAAERPRSCDKNTEFSCTTGQCIPFTQKCDGFMHCSDASDEQLCGWSSWEPWTDCATGASDERSRKRMCKSSVYSGGQKI